MTKPIHEVFWAHCDPSAGADACWPWLRAINKDGYGSLWIDGKSYGAHRVAYEKAFGPITDDLHVLHKCDNPACVNPGHLRLGTHIENMKDRSTKGRSNRPRGEKNPSSRFKADDVQEIRASLAAGESLGKIARRYGCDKSAISAIKRGTTWGWLTPLGQAGAERIGSGAH